jgi:PAS domain S-box-containing protein
MVIAELNKLRKKLILGTILLFTIITLFEGYSNYQKYIIQIDNIKRQTIKQTDFIYANKLAMLNQTLQFKIEAIIESPQIKKALLAKDRDTLYKVSKEKFKNLKDNLNNLTIMHYHLPNHTSFLRVHKNKSYGDNLKDKRPMITKCIQTQKPQIGYEDGLFDIEIAYRVAYPIFDKNRLIGILELGVDAKEITDTINQFFDINTNSRIYTGFLLTSNELQRKTKNIKFFNNYTLFTNSTKLETIINNITIPDSEQHITVQDRDYFIFWDKVKVKDFENNSIGTLIYAFEMTKIDQTIKKNIFITIIKSIVLMALGYIVLIGIFDYTINQNKMHNLRIENIVNNQRSMIIVTNGNIITRTNKTFLDFFNISKTSDFTDKYNCICEKFILDDDYIQRNMHDTDWKYYILNNPNYTHKIKLLDYDNEEHIFQVYIKKSIYENETEYVITLEDITILEDITKDLEGSIYAKTKELENINYSLENKIIEATLDISNQNSMLHESNQNFQNILDSTAEMIIFIDFGTNKIQEINRSGTNLLGYTDKKELIGKDILKFINDEDAYIINEKNITCREMHFIKKDGTKLDIILSIQEITRNKKSLKMINATNVTDLNKQRNYLNAIIESNNSAIIAINSQNKILTFNKKAEEIFGFDKKDMINTSNILQIIPPKYKELHTKAFDSYIQTGISKGVLYSAHELEGIKKDGTIFPINISFGVDKSNQIVIANIVDITQQKDKEKVFQQQARLAQMGEMISMIAHQWRQPLGSISSAVMSIQTKLEVGKFDLSIEEDRDKFIKYSNKKYSNINNYVQFLSTTIDDFRNFFKPDKDKEKVALEIPINKALQIVKVSLENKGIEIITNFESTEETEIYQNEVMQVVLNILKNAEDNFVEKETSNPKIYISTASKDNEYTITVLDNGGGIPSSVLPKIFDPYFSTKNEKNGTGLGLYMSKTMIEEHHNGDMSVRNVDDGAEFKITLRDV